MKQIQQTQTDESYLCPICKNGQTCEDLISHASKWNTSKGVKN